MPRKPTKRRRLPNGFGQISEIRGRNLRKPFRAMVSVGKNEEGRPIQRMLKPVAYFATYNEAYAALLEYQKHPTLSDDLTMAELYERFKEEVPPKTKGDAYVYTMWKHCEAVYDMKPRDIRKRHIRDCVEHHSPDIPLSNKPKVRLVLIRLLDYAMEYDLADHNYAKDYSLAKEIVEEISTNRREHLDFTDEEMDKLWEFSNRLDGARLLLIQCYMGWRPGEMCELRVRDVNISEGTITGGMKTDAGKNRVVPIHSRIKPFIAKYHLEATRYGRSTLFGTGQEPMTYHQYRTIFLDTVGKLRLNHMHKPHDPRVQFITMCKRYDVDEYAIKKMAGHTITDITEAVYTRRDVKWLKSELEKLR